MCAWVYLHAGAIALLAGGAERKHGIIRALAQPQEHLLHRLRLAGGRVLHVGGHVQIAAVGLQRVLVLLAKLERHFLRVAADVIAVLAVRQNQLSVRHAHC